MAGLIKIFLKDIPYFVVDHHSMWGWGKSNSTLEDAEVIFVWNDFSIENKIEEWKKQGKKIICFEHGWNAFFDYELNNHDFVADGYISLGKNSAKSLIRHGLNPKKVLITGNPNFDDIPAAKENVENTKPKILYTALHWTRDMTEYNNKKLDEIIKTFGQKAHIYI